MIALALLISAAPPGASLEVASPAQFYLVGETYSVTARFRPESFPFSSTSPRLSVRLPSTGGTVGLRPQTVTLEEEGAGTPYVANVSAASMSACVTSDFSCPSTRSYAGCSVSIPANTPTVDVFVTNVAVVDIGSGDFEVDVIPGDVGLNRWLRVTVSFSVEATTMTGTSQHVASVCGQDMPGWSNTTYSVTDTTTHNVEARAVTTLGVSAPSPIVRGQMSTVVLSAADQNGVAMSAAGALVTIDEHLGTPAGPQVPVGQQGSLAGLTYSPASAPRSETVAVTVSATLGSASGMAQIDVAPGAITSLQLVPASATINPGQTADFNPRGFNASGGEEVIGDADVVYSVAPFGAVNAAGIVSIPGGAPPAPTTTLTATLDAISAQATITVPRLPLTACAMTLEPASVGPADASRPRVGGSDATASYDLTADATFSWDPPNALVQRGDVLAPVRAGPLTVTVTAAVPACPGGSVQATLDIRATASDDIVALAFSGAQSLSLIVDAVRSVSVVAVRADGSQQPLEPTEWIAGPGVVFLDEQRPTPGPARQTAPGTRDLRATESGTSFVTVRYNALEATLPVSIDERYLTIEWLLSKTSARQGELVTATVTAAVTNARAPHPGVTLTVTPPGGLRVVGPAPTFTFDVPAGGSRQSFSVPMMAAARAGTWKLRASATEADAVLTESEAPAVRIVEDPEFAEALLIGRVFDDKNENGRADEDEPGLPGVTLGLTAGIFVTTDQNGNYHVPALQPGSVVVKIDTNTLPHMAPLTTPERFPIVLTPGQIFRADFGVNLAQPAAPVLTRDTSRAARIVKTKDGREYVLPIVMQHGARDTEKREAWTVRVPITGVRNEKLVQASGDNGTTGRYRVVVRRYVSGDAETYVADPPELIGVDYPAKPDSTHFLVALGEGIVGFEPRQGWPGGLYWDGKLAFAYRGRILGKYLIDAGGDTTWREIPNFFQRDTKRIFRNLDPDAYYPVYGDNAQIVDERAGGQKLYVRVEAGPVMARWGAFQTGLNTVQFGRYDRSIVGAQARLLWDRPSGDAHKVILFYAKPDTQRAHDELLATGTSLYYMSRQNIVEGSEQIWFERRQQRTGLVRERKLLRPGADYQVDYVAGRILLDQAPASLLPSQSALRQNAADGDEGWLLVDYEVVGNVFAAGQDDVIGGRIAERPVRGLEIGATGVTELRRGAGNYYLVGGDLSFSLWEPLKLRAEYAHSESTLQARGLSLDGGLSYVALPDTGATGGDAAAARLSFDKWDVKAEAYGRVRTQGFNDTSNAPGEKLTQAGFTLRSPNWHGFMAVLSLDDTRREASYSVLPGLPTTGVRLGRQTTEVELSQAIGPVTLLASARYAGIAPGFGAGREAVIAGGVVWRIIPGLAIGAVHQQPLYRDGDRLFDSLGRDTQLLTRFVIKNAEVEAAGGYGERGPSGRAGVRVPIDQDTSLTAGMLFGGTLINESISFGLRRRTGEGTFAYADNQFQSTPLGRLQSHVGGLETRFLGNHVLSLSFEAGKRNPGTALDANIERYGAGAGYAFMTEKFQLRSRLEGRIESIDRTTSLTEGTRTLGGFVRADWKATETLSFAAWAKGSGSVSAVDESVLASFVEAAFGFAYRPRWVLKPTILGRYAFTHERLPRAQNPTGAFTDAHIASLAFTFDPWKYVGLLGKVAGRIGTLTIPQLGNTGLMSFLAIPRVNLHITKMFDVSGEYRACVDRNIGTKHGALVELSALIVDYVRVGAGYNFSMIDDVSVDCQSQRALGFFVRAQAFY